MMNWLSDNWLCVAVIGFIILMMFFGHCFGFLRIALSFSSFVVSVIVARILQPFAVQFIWKLFKISDDGKSGKIIVFIVLFIIIWLLLRIVIKTAKIIDKIPVLRGMNQTLGCLIGLIFAAVILYVLSRIITNLSAMEWAQNILGMIEKNKVLKFVYDLTNIVTK